SMLPSLSRLARENPPEAEELSRKALIVLLCLSLPVAVGSTVMAEPIINFFYTAQFAPSIPILALIGWTTVPMYLGIGMYQVLTAHDRQGVWTKLMVMAIFANGGLNLVLIPVFQQNFDNGGIGACL